MTTGCSAATTGTPSFRPKCAACSATWYRQASAAVGGKSKAQHPRSEREKIPMKVRFYEDTDDQLLKFAVILAESEGKWVLCKHKERDTHELPGGHREAGESIDDTARRKLQEETGAEAPVKKGLHEKIRRSTVRPSGSRAHPGAAVGRCAGGLGR